MNKVSDEQLHDWGFNENVGNDTLKLFFMLPIYPDIATRPEIMKKMNCDSTRLAQILSKLPADAPVIEDDGILSRLK